DRLKEDFRRPQPHVRASTGPGLNRNALCLGWGMRTAFLYLLALSFGSMPLLRADDALDRAIDAITPDIQKWAAVCVVTRDAQGVPSFHWTDYRDTGTRTDFWPASTIKLYS